MTKLVFIVLRDGCNLAYGGGKAFGVKLQFSDIGSCHFLTTDDNAV